MKTYLPKMISYFCFDKVNECFLCSLSLPYDKRNDKDIASMLKKGAATKIPEEDVIVRVFRKRNVIKDRAFLRMASGIVLDFPSDATDFDLEIIKAQLKVLLMQFHKGHKRLLKRTVPAE